MQTYSNPLLNLHEITLGLLNEDNPDNLLDTILDQTIEFTKADSGSIALLDDTRKYLDIKAFRGLSTDVPEKVKLKLGEGVTGRCILTGKTRNVGNTSEDPYYVSVRSDIQSELAVPLKAGSKSFGVISVDSSRKNAFNDTHEEYLSLLASYAAQILTKQETIRHLNHRTNIQNILIEISGYLGKYPVFSKVFQEIILHLQKTIGLERAAVFITEPVSGRLGIVNSLNYTEEEKEKSNYRPNEGITGTVFSKSEPVYLQDIDQDKTFLNKSGAERPKKKMSFFSSPILVNDEPRGVFNMEIPYTSLARFEDYSFLVQILSTLFSQAISIQNFIEESKNDIEEENILLKRQFDSNYSFENIVGRSKSMQDLFQVMQMSADSNTSILLTGESGTGKELFATAIHRNSMRKTKKLVKINCAAIPSDLLESELFGYDKGAFTGADRDHKGKFLIAHEGTLLLDEVGEMDYKLQSKLLRFLQDKEFSPLGSNKVYKVDVRIIAATNANLETNIRDKKFREDLYYRLNVIRIEIPPLRDRMEDLPFISDHLLRQIAKRNGKPQKTLSDAGFARLENYSFPGNIRELENILERAYVLSSDKLIKPAEIVIPETQTRIQQTEKTVKETEVEQPGIDQWVDDIIQNGKEGEYYKNVIQQVEEILIVNILKNTFYNKSKTARMLGVNRLTLDKKIKELGLQ
ncbi:MAG: sigma 54-interacting transcriptional regulator [Leptospirales bacterium]